MPCQGITFKRGTNHAHSCRGKQSSSAQKPCSYICRRLRAKLVCPCRRMLTPQFLKLTPPLQQGSLECLMAMADRRWQSTVPCAWCVVLFEQVSSRWAVVTACLKLSIPSPAQACTKLSDLAVPATLHTDPPCSVCRYAKLHQQH